VFDILLPLSLTCTIIFLLSRKTAKPIGSQSVFHLKLAVRIVFSIALLVFPVIVYRATEEYRLIWVLSSSTLSVFFLFFVWSYHLMLNRHSLTEKYLFHTKTIKIAEVVKVKELESRGAKITARDGSGIIVYPYVQHADMLLNKVLKLALERKSNSKNPMT